VVTWRGPRPDIPAVLAASEVFVLPSDREGLSRVLLEAAAMELPLVTTAVPGCRDIVEEGVNGFLVAPRDAPALAQAIARLVADADLRRRLGLASRQRVLQHFDLGIVAEQTLTAYRTLLQRKGRLPMDAMPATGMPDDGAGGAPYRHL
jgi:glycosyltransferase involved in cell wall biosynthesis